MELLHFKIFLFAFFNCSSQFFSKFFQYGCIVSKLWQVCFFVWSDQVFVGPDNIFFLKLRVGQIQLQQKQSDMLVYQIDHPH